MNIKIVMLGLSIGVSTLAVGCGSTSPKGYAKTSARLNCKTIKKCDEAAWDLLGYDSVSECVDEVATDDKIEAFVDACEDFDSKSARQCLSYGRKYKRSCDESDLTDADAIKVCSEVCGNAAQMGLVLDPTNPDSLADVMTRALEISEAEYEDEAPASFSAPAE